MRAEESSRNVTEEFSCIQTPPSEPTSETSNCEDTASSSISFGSLPVLHTDSDFLALDLTNPNVNTDENVSEVQDSSLLADDPPVIIGSSSNLPVIDASPSEDQLPSRCVNTLNMDEFIRIMEDFKSSFNHQVLNPTS